MSDTVPGVYKVERPRTLNLPLVLDSPHSGERYPGDFNTPVPMEVLRRAEDMYVDDLFAGAVDRGSPLISALFPRSYIDPNRALQDLDRELLEEPWPEPVQPSEKARLGHGLIWRVCPPDLPMYVKRLTVEEVKYRIATYWHAYHAALSALLDEAQDRFGKAWLLDCHSMPSVSLPKEPRFGGVRRAEFILGDRDGTTCSTEFLYVVRDTLKSFGYHVKINDPYKGVEIIRRHGRPAEGRHSLQIEINRALYMNEETFERTVYYAELQGHMSRLVEVIGDYSLDRVGAKAAE